MKRNFCEIRGGHLDFLYFPHKAQDQPGSMLCSLTACSHLSGASLTWWGMFGALGVDFIFTVLELSVIRGHMFDSGGMIFNHPSLPVPWWGVVSVPGPAEAAPADARRGMQWLKAAGTSLLPQVPQGPQVSWQQPVGVRQMHRGEALPSLKLSLPLPTLYLPSLFCSGG